MLPPNDRSSLLANISFYAATAAVATTSPVATASDVDDNYVLQRLRSSVYRFYFDSRRIYCNRIDDRSFDGVIGNNLLGA
ncbi:hypothetical protein SNEBB_001297 [Seison nebaliae]|nr:hypothetical protein SNEBB_001297 [Seison nebaliae]